SCLLSQRLPNAPQIERETRHRTFPLHPLRLHPRLRLAFWTKDFHGAPLWIDQPGELRPVPDPLPHLGAQGWQTIRVGTELNYEIGTEMPVALEFFVVEPLNSALIRPRRV